MSDTPKARRPRDLSQAEAGFETRPMVDWFNPLQLAHTGLQVAVSSLFGSYADKRELMAYAEPPFYDYSHQEALWFDYTADLGDGFDSTYAVASLLAAPSLSVNGVDQPLPRGELLLLGGDEVYPTASRDEYSNRMTGPYAAALPWVEDEEARPHLYALPGNHDWYDGLTTFSRLFCQQRGIGGWVTRQSRSYFALKLPHGWWLWGVDVQLASDVDHPQIKFFDELAREAMAEGDRVILCGAEPSWVYRALGDAEAMRNLSFFRDHIIGAHQGRVALMLAGDLHHYCHFSHADGESHRITCGGGGAFLHGTHNLPETLPEERPGEGEFQRQAVYPEEETSRALTWENWKFPLTNRAFSLFMGAFYLLYAWMLESTSMGLSSTYFPGSLSSHFATLPLTFGGIGEVVASYLKILVVSPSNLVLGLVLILGMYTFVEAPPQYSPKVKWLIGLGHGTGHLLLNLLLFWALVQLNDELFGLALKGWGSLLFAGEMLALGSLCAGLAMGIHLLWSNLGFGYNRTPSFSSLRVADYKSLLRLHIDRDGLTLYPLALDKVPTQWRADPEGGTESPWFVPTDHPLTVRLIEQPIRIPAKES